MTLQSPTIGVSAQALTSLVEELKEEWRAGQASDAVRRIRDFPELLSHRSLVVQLGYEDYCLREENGCAHRYRVVLRRISGLSVAASRGHSRPSQTRRSPRCSSILAGRFSDSRRRFRRPEHHSRARGGAFARVYLVTDPGTGHRPLVVKFSRLPSREGRTLGSNEHAHIVPVHWAREIEALSAVCMPYVGTTTLRNLIDAVAIGGRRNTAREIRKLIAGNLALVPFKPKPHASHLLTDQSFVDSIAAIAAPLADALAHLHRNGVSHGDLKPSNVLLGPGGYPYLIDFNLAGEEDGSLLRCGGTLAYMAPERIRLMLNPKAEPDRADRADIYSFGAVLHECLTGSIPFPIEEEGQLRDTAQELLTMQAAGLRRQRMKDARIPHLLANLVDACLDADPQKRPSAGQIAQVLKEFANRRARRVQRLFAATAITIAIALACTGIARLTAQEDPAPSAPPTSRSARQAPLPAVFRSTNPFDEGLEALRKDNVAAAIAAFGQAGRLNADGRTYAYRAYCAARSGQNRPAAVFFDKAIKLGYACVWVLNDRAYVLSQFNRRDPAQMNDAMSLVTRAP